MFCIFCLSETASAVLWLWETDRGNWTVGTHAVVHRPTGVGVWTANSAYGLHINYEIPEEDREKGFPLNGKKIRIKWYDRRVLARVIISGLARTAPDDIQHKIFKFGYNRGLNHG